MSYLTSFINFNYKTCLSISHIIFSTKYSSLEPRYYYLAISYRDTMKRTKVKEETLASAAKRSSSSIEDEKPTDRNFGFGERKQIDEAEFKKFLLKIKEAKHAYAPSIEEYDFNEKRSRCINGISAKSHGDYKGVSYWMFRDQRIDDNWALICAQKFALQHKCPLYVTFYLMSHYSVAGTRQYDFLLRGLQQVEKQCQKLGIQFHLELGYAKDHIVDYCEEYDIDMVVCDFNPLRDPLSWVEEAGIKLKKKNIPLYQVDAHNIVPVWVTSEKLEFAARTIRPKVHKHLKEFLTEIPPLEKHPYQPDKETPPTDWDKAWGHLKVDETVRPITWAEPGTVSGYRMLFEFITQRLRRFDDDRNIPTKNGLSCLSPYYHFGQLSVQRAILCLIDKSVKAKAAKSVDAYIEEAVVRRELSDNFCFYQPDYDNYNGAWAWAKKSIEEHRRDKREYIYSQEELRLGKTHDKLWNAAQIQMLQEGKMHGYIRMYWAKKILEWTPSVEEALRIAMWLNDKYEMDGRDPNGYVGIMWSMVGVHDRAWTERPVFGKIRYMNYKGCERKFDVDRYARIYKSI